MAQLLERHAEREKELREGAKAVAERFLSGLEFGPLLEDPEAALAVIREGLLKELLPQVREAFRDGKRAAYEVIAAVPPVTSPPDVPKGLNAGERKRLGPRVDAWSLSVAGENAAFAKRLKAYLRARRAQGHAIESIAEFLGRDWETAGRLSGPWRNFMRGAAADLIGQAELVGQECGYHGVGR